MNEMTLADHITLRQPTDLPLPNQMPYLARRSPASGMAPRTGGARWQTWATSLTGPRCRPDLHRIRRRRRSRPLRQPGRLSEKRYRAEQNSNFGNVHVTVFSLRP